MRRRRFEVYDLETRLGVLRALEVRGAWTADCTRAFRAGGCQAISWRPGRSRSATCSPLVGLKDLRLLTVTSENPLDDSDIAELVDLEQLDVASCAKNPLDLSGCTKLRHLGIGDRPGLSGLALPLLQSVALSRSERPLADFATLPRLTSLTVEGVATNVLDLEASLPNMTRLRITTGMVTHLDRLVTPQLELLHLDVASDLEELDLGSLVEMPRLRWLNVRGPKRVRNIRPLLTNPHMRVVLEPQIQIIND